MMQGVKVRRLEAGTKKAAVEKDPVTEATDRRVPTPVGI